MAIPNKINMYIAFLVILSVLCGINDAKIISLNHLDIKSNGVPVNLDLHDANNEDAFSGKKDFLAEKYKEALKMEVRPYFHDEEIKIPVEIINEKNEIVADHDAKDFSDSRSSGEMVIDDLSVSDEELKITNIVLTKIREMLENEELESARRRAEYKVYVPISEDIVNPDFIPQGLRASVNPIKKDGLLLIDLEGRAQS